MTSHGQRGLQLSYNFIKLPSVVRYVYINGEWIEQKEQ